MKDQISDLYQQIAGEESTTLGDLLSRIPGISGYMERGRRRDADQILRETIVGRLEQVRLRLNGVNHDLSQNMGLAMQYAEQVGRVDTQLMGLTGKINDAPQGYAGFFDAIKVKADDLARLYFFDQEMLGYVDLLDEDVSALQTAVLNETAIDEAIKQLLNDVAQANETFSARTEVLRGIS
jgi:hypothetical protein